MILDELLLRPPLRARDRARNNAPRMGNNLRPKNNARPSFPHNKSLLPEPPGGPLKGRLRGASANQGMDLMAKAGPAPIHMR